MIRQKLTFGFGQDKQIEKEPKIRYKSETHSLAHLGIP